MEMKEIQEIKKKLEEWKEKYAKDYRVSIEDNKVVFSRRIEITQYDTDKGEALKDAIEILTYRAIKYVEDLALRLKKDSIDTLSYSIKLKKIYVSDETDDDDEYKVEIEAVISFYFYF